MTTQTWFQIAIVGFGAMATSLAALAYLRRVTLERPAIGKFNGRDLVTLFVLIVTLPILYLALPATALTGFLVITFSSALFIALRPVISQNWRRIAVPVLLAANIVVAHTLLGRTGGWQIYWIMTSAIVLVAAVGVSNLYVQGGMSMRHVAWFAIFLAAYDAFFTMVIPLTSPTPSWPDPWTRQSASGSPATTQTSASATCSSTASSCSPPTKVSDNAPPPPRSASSPSSAPSSPPPPPSSFPISSGGA
jgi:hypothetical protein